MYPTLASVKARSTPPARLGRPGLPHRIQSGGHIYTTRTVTEDRSTPWSQFSQVYPTSVVREDRSTPPVQQGGHIYPTLACTEARSTQPPARLRRPCLPRP